MKSHSKHKMQDRIWAADAYKLAAQFELAEDLQPIVTWNEHYRVYHLNSLVSLIKQRFGGKHGDALHNYYIVGPEDVVRKLLSEHCNKDRCILEMPII